MRIVYWTELFWPYIGGVEVMSLHLLPQLRARGCEFVVITSHCNVELPDEDSFHGIPVHRFPFRDAIAKRNLDAMATIRRRISSVLENFRPDIIHFCGIGTGPFFHGTGKSDDGPAVLVTLQQQLLPLELEQPQSVLSSALRKANWVTAVSDAALQQARALVPAITPTSSVVYNFVETPAVEPLPLPFDPPVLLCIGRLIFQKGFDIALKAFAGIVAKFPSTRLRVAGDGVDRPMLEKLAADLGIRSSVDFLGWVQPEAVPDLLNKCSIVLMPSRYEGLPVVAVQAALMARPIIASRVGGNPEAVMHEETGLMFDADDVTALAASITYLLEHPQVAQAWGNAARERTRRVFDPERCISRYHAIYEQLAAKSAAHG